MINAGNVEAKGTHTELLESCELYRNMWDVYVYAKDVYEMEGGTKGKLMRKLELKLKILLIKKVNPGHFQIL